MAGHRDKEQGFHPALPLVFHPCHLFSRPRTRRTQRPGARVEGGVVICRPGRHWVETEQCCMYSLSWQRPFVGNPPARQDHPCNPPLGTTLQRAWPGPGKRQAATNGQMRGNLGKQALQNWNQPQQIHRQRRPASLLAWTIRKWCEIQEREREIEQEASLICVRQPAAKWQRREQVSGPTLGLRET